MAARRDERLPVRPLVRYLKLYFDPDVDDEVIAHACGISVRTLHRWRTGETRDVYLDAADRIATALGAHPTRIWPEYDADLELVAA